MTSQRPLLIVITVCYNAEKTIGLTLKSVAEQTTSEFEYLVVDGASTDRTLELVAALRRPVEVVSERDQGIYDAMNKGLDHAKGDYVWFLNAGDQFFSPDTVAQVIAQLRANEYPDVLYGETALVDEKGDFLRMRRLQAPEQLTWRSFQRGMLVSHQAMVVKRAIVPRYDRAFSLSADFDWAIVALQRARSIHNSHLTLANYLSEGATTANRSRSHSERYDIMAHYYGALPTLMWHLWFALRFAFAALRRRL